MDTQVNVVAVLVAAVAQFVVGAIWYMPLFGDLWGRIHGFDRKSKAAQNEMRKGMGPLLVVQFLTAVVSAYVLATLIGVLPNESPYLIAFYVWLGFIVTTQVGAVIFGGTEEKWVLKKIGVMAGGALATTMVAAFVIASFGS